MTADATAHDVLSRDGSSPDALSTDGSPPDAACTDARTSDSISTDGCSVNRPSVHGRPEDRVPTNRRSPNAVWTSANGVPVRDLVPAALRRAWTERGLCPGRDLYSLFSAHVRDHPHREAVVDADGVLDYAALDAEVRRVAALLAASGLTDRDIVAVRVPNDRRAVAAELAVAALGAVALPYPAGHGSRDTVNLLGRSRARGAVFAEPPSAEVRDRLPELRAVWTYGAPRAGARSLDGEEAPAGWRPRPVDPEAPARILVSSGSEAEPKMVAYSHNAFAGGRARYVRALATGAEPMRNLLLAQLSSSYGSCGTYVTLAALGGTLLLPGTTDPGDALRMASAHRATHLFGVPTLLRRLADHPPAPGENLDALRALVSSSAELPEATAAACRARFGRPVITVYGSSDGVNCHTAGAGSAPGTDAGRPDPAVAEIRITAPGGDPDTAPLPPGEPGQICARGPMTPLCYVGGPGLDARYRTATGWVRTGDRGLIDAGGRLHVLGRLREFVKRGGLTISPAEVERELGAHPGLAEVACVGVPDPELGERLCAVVRVPPGAPAPALRELTEFLESQRGLERRKLPERLVRVDAMPLSPTGKVCRRTLAGLAARAAAGSGPAP